MDVVGRMSSTDIQGNGIVYAYPSGDFDILCASDMLFTEDGYEPAEGKRREGAAPAAREAGKKSEGADMLRSARRARSKLRRLALSNEFSHFVTLTLDPAKIDRCDPVSVQRALSTWLSNMVQRHGLKYVIVPEQHKDGAWHFHGLFAGRLDLVDSGTIKRASGGKPRRPKDAAQRAEWLAEGGHVVYNLPQWSLGFSTAITLYGQYSQAVGYVCKYIGKQNGERPLGRWYYSGGGLVSPQKTVCTLDYRQIREDFAGDCVEFDIPGSSLLVVHIRSGRSLDDAEEGL